ncbi:PAS domain-containing sensor histidine kinase [Qipengyuania sediminis]|uniref:PAS domain-containing sensor histidine kinase n=1 Tax=Qipengyuania sediminis TaxID=1532023 RepID=UPI001059C6E6|nr:PAS domain-containing sensor histidine kinase [Qipengyuania sediminis]
MSEPPPADEDLSDLYEDAPCGYLSLTPSGRIARLNLTLSQWLGRAPGELAGRSFFDIVSFGGRIAYETHLAPMLRLRGHVDEIALDLLGASGEKIPVIANAREKRAPGGAHAMTRITLFKAVERRQYEHSLLEARYRAEAAAAGEQETARLREQFIAVLGHDLRNPLAAIGAGARMLGKEVLSERGRTVLGEMQRSLGRASALIDDVLDFARGRLGGGLILDPDDRAPFTPVLEQVVAEVRAAAPGRGIEALIDILEPLKCDRQRLGQLAANLLSNAIMHGDAGHPVELEARSLPEAFTLSVTNRGAPIPEEVRENLFHPFFRGGARESRQGLGLGLFIVSEIARAHGGRVEVTSDETATRFAFTMPV